MFGDVPVFEQRMKGWFSDQGDLRVGPTSANRAEQGESHDDIAQPIRQANPNAGAAG